MESYDYLGAGTVVKRGHPLSGVDQSFILKAPESFGDAGDQYTGLDRFGRIADQRWRTSSADVERTLYGYDRNGNRTSRTNTVNAAYSEVYTYDGLNQLASFNRNSGARTQSWDYDALGNWDSLTTNGGSTQTRTHNKQNEITAVSGATSPTFDANGNMTTDETGKQYVYDAWNRLVVVKNSGGTTLKTYTYDALNRRVAETASGTTTDLYYSAGWQVLEEAVSGTTTQRYVWSPVYVDAMILRDRDTDANGSLDERLWAMQDANWNVVGLVNGSGTVVERYAYDPFGSVTVMNGSWSGVGSSAYGWVYLYQGKPLDSSSGLYNIRRREYSPTMGRWTSIDPLMFAADDNNLFRFVENRPTGLTDPSGLQSYLPGWNPYAPPNGITGRAPAMPALPTTLEQFTKWYKDNANTDWVKELPDCPCSIPVKGKFEDRWVTMTGRDCRRVSVFVVEVGNPDPDVWEDPKEWQLGLFRAVWVDFHPGAKYDMRSKKTYNGHAQQCTYDGDGKLITHGPGAGTPDWGAVGTKEHSAQDVDPFLWALELDGGKPGKYVDMYLERRPPNKGKDCPQNPKAVEYMSNYYKSPAWTGKSK